MSFEEITDMKQTFLLAPVVRRKMPADIGQSIVRNELHGGRRRRRNPSERRRTPDEVTRSNPKHEPEKFEHQRPRPAEHVLPPDHAPAILIGSRRRLAG